MARLNTHLSATPQQTRSSTVDSLYRDPSVAPRHASNARDSTYSVMSPSQSSDKENMESQSRENTPQPAKRKGLSNASGRIPTPDTGSTTGGAGNKRRRTGNYNMNGASETHEDEEEDQEQQREATSQPEEEEDSQSKLYNPNQDPEKRRQVRYQLRDHHRQLEGGCSRTFGTQLRADKVQRTAIRSSNQRTTAYLSCSRRMTLPLEKCDKRQMRQSIRDSW